MQVLKEIILVFKAESAWYLSPWTLYDIFFLVSIDWRSQKFRFAERTVDPFNNTNSAQNLQLCFRTSTLDDYTYCLNLYHTLQVIHATYIYDIFPWYLCTSVPDLINSTGSHEETWDTFIFHSLYSFPLCVMHSSSSLHLGKRGQFFYCRSEDNLYWLPVQCSVYLAFSFSWNSSLATQPFCTSAFLLFLPSLYTALCYSKKY